MKNRALVFGSGFGDGGCHEDLGIGHFNHRCHSIIFQRSDLIQYFFKAEVPAHRLLRRERLGALHAMPNVVAAGFSLRNVEATRWVAQRGRGIASPLHRGQFVGRAVPAN